MSELPAFWQTDIPGRNLTSSKVGGPVAYLARPTTIDELAETVQLAVKRELPWRVIGGGSNILLPDEGFPGVLIQPLFTQIQRLTISEIEELQEVLSQAEGVNPPEARYASLGENRADLLQLSVPVLANESGAVGYVEAGSTVPWGRAVMYTLGEGLSGLHWFARIPCQVGGGIYNNIHGEKRFLSEFVGMVRSFDPISSQIKTYSLPELQFAYDKSIFHTKYEIIISAVFRLTQSSPPRIKADRDLYLEWTKRKGQVQPSGANSGSAFRNFSPEEVQRVGQEAVAAAWYIEQAGLKGKTVGGMQVYPGHANFIINLGDGSQADFRQLVEIIQQQIWERFGLWLLPEVECLQPNGKVMVWERTPSA